MNPSSSISFPPSRVADAEPQSSSSQLLQLVNEEKEFSRDFDECLRQNWNLYDCGLDYHAVAVVGAQSTGKSTLMNELFGTSFEIMGERSRQQTTKGIWIGKAMDKNVLVLDFEGTDGRERGEDQDFERKSTLFALAIAEVVIINLWETSIGLYNAANMSLLKTVLEVNLQLFQREGSPKTHLFFLIRDHSSSTPIESLSQTIHEDLQKIWRGIAATINSSQQNNLNASRESANSGLENRAAHSFSVSPTITSENDILFSSQGTQKSLATTRLAQQNSPASSRLSVSSSFVFFPSDFSSLFQVSVFSLPHMKLRYQEFKAGITQLRSRFFESSDPNYVFCEDCQKNVPADGFSEFSKTVWETIMANKDLDLPTQQELLAQFRCDALGADAVSLFTNSCAQEFPSIPGGVFFPDLGPQLDQIANSSMYNFDKRARRYSVSVYSKKRLQVLESMCLHASTIFASQVRSSSRNVLNDFRKALENLVVNSKTPDFSQEVDGLISEAKSSFFCQLNESKMSGANWSTVDSEKSLNDELLSLALAKKNEILNENMRRHERCFKHEIFDNVETVFASYPTDLSDAVKNVFQKRMECLEKQFSTTLELPLDTSPRSTFLCLTKLRIYSATCLRNALEHATSDLNFHSRLKRDFENAFRYDSDGVPRVWKPSQDMEAVFKMARSAPMNMVNQLFQFNIPWLNIFKPLESVQSDATPKSSKQCQLIRISDHELVASANTETETIDSSLEIADRDGITAEMMDAAMSELSRLLHDYSQQPIISQSRLAEASARFKLESDAIYMEAKRAVVAQTTQVPWWFFVIVAVLGWNEFLFLLTSPLALLALLLAGALGYLLYVTGLARPAISACSYVVGEIVGALGMQMKASSLALNRQAQRAKEKNARDFDEIEMKKLD